MSYRKLNSLWNLLAYSCISAGSGAVILTYASQNKNKKKNWSKMATKVSTEEERKMATTEKCESGIATEVCNSSRNKASTKIFNDPIHGTIELDPLLVKIIDTPQFQRLRFIKQMGGVYFVYPGASHNRFEHSIGVCYLAGCLVRALRNQKSKALENIEITPKDELCVQIAALCHDLGHGPFSHLFDSHFLPATPRGMKLDKRDKLEHEQRSIDMFEHMLKENNELEEAFQKENIMQKDRDFIKEMIVESLNSNRDLSREDWENNYKGRPWEKRFLYEIVSNKGSGIDVDKWDYFARDSYMLGMGNNFNYKRCIAFSRVIEVDGKNQICYRDKEAYNLYDMFHTRLLLHKRACKHKTVNSIEHMLADVLVSADKFIKFERTDGKNLSMSGTIDDMKAFTLLTDNVIHRILESNDDGLNVAKEILQRIFSRDLYFCKVEKIFPGKSFKDKEAVEEKMFVDKARFETIKHDCVIDLTKFNYGKKHENPLEHVNYYSKKNPDVAEPKKMEDVSLLLPKVFEEQLVRVYWKKDKDDTRLNEIIDPNWSELENEPEEGQQYQQ